MPTGITPKPKNKTSTTDLIGTIANNQFAPNTVPVSALIGDTTEGDLYQSDGIGNMVLFTPNDILYGLPNPDSGGTNDGELVAVLSGALGTYQYLPVPPTYNTSTVTGATPAASAQTSIVHGLTGVPSTVRVVLICDNDDAGTGYVVGDEINIESVTSGTSNIPCFYVQVTSTNIIVGRSNGATNIKLISKGGGAIATATSDSNFSLKCYAVYYN